MKVINRIFYIVGAIYCALAVLASFDMVDLHTCISNAGRCHVTISKEK